MYTTPYILAQARLVPSLILRNTGISIALNIRAISATQDIVRCYKSRTHFSSFFSQNNINIDLTYTTHNLNNFNKYHSITCSYIQEYLGYLSNNLYFLFSHSWPVVGYTFGQVQRTSKVERKTKCSKKTTAGDIAVLWTALLTTYIFK